MKILIDGYWWDEGPYSNRLVLLEIVENWLKQFPDDMLCIASPSCSRNRRNVPDGAVRIPTRLRIHPLINAIELPLIARRQSVDAILTFNFASPTNYTAAFVHDMMYQTNPEWFTTAERFYFLAGPALITRARSVITTSHTERLRILAANPNLRRVAQCGLAVFPGLAEAEPQAPRLNLRPRSFVLCVGRFNIRKNLEMTVRALLHSGVISKECPLVIIGEPSGMPSDLTEFDAPASDRLIVVVGNVTNAELKWLYLNCLFFTCLSLDEGFGLPVVEAASFGAPVLASDIPIFRETIGSHGTLVDPLDIDSISAAAKSLSLQDPNRPPFVEDYTWNSVCACIRAELVRVAR